MSSVLNKYFDEKKEKLLTSLLHETLEANKKFNLTAIVDPSEFEIKMILDSALVLNYISFKDKKVIDIGTGAGFPGVVISILDECEIDLLDATKKKVEYLKSLKEKYEYKINPICERAEIYSSLNRETYDYALARSVSSLKILIEIIVPLLKVGGTLICYKGPNYLQEIQDAKSLINKIGVSIEKIEETALPSGEKRYFVFIKKNKITASKYPREYKDIVK